MFGLTPAEPKEERSSSLGDETAPPLVMSPTTAFSFAENPPLVPIPFRPSHLKSASDYPSPTSEGDYLRSAFPGRKTAMVRKKSGELVRSSLKMGEMTKIAKPTSPKSAPATPTCPKYVHFDTQLEHVKLFLTQQKPAAVSRSGSPTLETETEDEPEAFPFPAMTTSQPGLLALKLPNFPKRVNVDQDAFLESLEIAADGKSLRGIVRVKNLSFHKWVAVRFTLDNWQTVSEVSAEHLQSFSATVDRFVFGIKLQDLLARIEEKTMFVAIRYTVDGREIWDNNGGDNYRVEFTKRQVVQPPAMAPVQAKRPAWAVAQAGEAADRMADLRRELDRLVSEEHDAAPLRADSRRADTRTYTEGGPSAFTARYDFGTSFKPSSPSFKPASPVTSKRTNSPPKSASSYKSSPVTGGRALPTDFGPSYSSLYHGETYSQPLHRPPSPPPETESNFYRSQQPHDYSKSTQVPTSRFNSYPAPMNTSYTPLLPPSFRDQRRRSPFASPIDSPVDSPTQSPRSRSPPLHASTKLFDVASVSSSTVASGESSRSSPASQITTVPSSPAPETASDFSTFLDRVSARRRFAPR